MKTQQTPTQKSQKHRVRTFPIYQNKHSFELYVWLMLQQNLSDLKITMKYFLNNRVINTAF